MATLVRLPRLGANVSEGTVGTWHVAEGEQVAPGEPLVEIITSKAAFDVEAPTDGVLLKAVAPERSIVPVGYILAICGDPGESLPDVEAENAKAIAEFRRAAEASGPGVDRSDRPRIKATPGARRLAAQEGVDLGDVPPGGGSGVIREEDVRRFLSFRREA